MSEELNGLKALILRENSSIFYVHYFAHHLQLALVGVVNKHNIIELSSHQLLLLLTLLGNLLIVVTFFDKSKLSKSLKHLTMENFQVGKD